MKSLRAVALLSLLAPVFVACGVEDVTLQDSVVDLATGDARPPLDAGGQDDRAADANDRDAESDAVDEPFSDGMADDRGAPPDAESDGPEDALDAAMDVEPDTRDAAPDVKPDVRDAEPDVADAAVHDADATIVDAEDDHDGEDGDNRGGGGGGPGPSGGGGGSDN